MPHRDKTGPEGEGPKTGRGAGDCDTWQKDQIQYQQSDFMLGTTDYAKDQYQGKNEFAIQNQQGAQYPDRTDSTNTEYYGRRRRKGQE
jgi:hypothetical protein